MVWVDLLDSVGGLKTLLGGYFGHFSPISCLNVSHHIVYSTKPEGAAFLKLTLGSFCCFSHLPNSPIPQFPNSPIPHFPSSPLPHFPTSPSPHFPTSPLPSPHHPITPAPALLRKPF
ncbi:hypothetical protein MAE_19980 [Microcystis aeruginosa NIES-843]|uniref:Uncharacterized protein n=1 Tax=Microcystis aeruginosa (strain NIES-843 / IAM M-2473) TaxID=449447 RepID=B0JXJ3_MICAN|nr:hypothetical protein MAE_19980 [Microcystis aeruginosa NIES-843]